MREAALGGRSMARHPRGDVYELRVAVQGRAWRLLFSAEGRSHSVLLALSSFEKKTQQTPLRELELAPGERHVERVVVSQALMDAESDPHPKVRWSVQASLSDFGLRPVPGDYHA
jgi:Phage derived protein Gp49-like (DUF891)